MRRVGRIASPDRRRRLRIAGNRRRGSTLIQKISAVLGIFFQGITAVAAIGALWVSALAISKTGDQIQAAQEQNKVVQEGQFTDRYTKAIEQLGKMGEENVQIRLGGIYALERLARDSIKDQSTIVETLSSFVRTASGRPEGLDGKLGTCSDRAVAPDVNAALVVLGRRDTTRDRGAVVSLRYACLRNLSVGGISLKNANLFGADLRGASLVEVDLSYSFLFETDLSGARFVNSKLSHAFIMSSHIVASHLKDSDLSEAIFYDTDISSTHFESVNLQGARLSGTELSKSKLTNTDTSRIVAT